MNFKGHVSCVFTVVGFALCLYSQFYLKEPVSETFLLAILIMGLSAAEEIEKAEKARKNQ